MEKITDRLNELITLFNRNLDQYKSGKYDEYNTRADFIDKFFELLDWDMYNKDGFAEQYRDVVREDKVRIEGKPKAPDYSFRIGGVRKFFVEAKKPSVDIKNDVEPAFQVRRYAYTANLPLSILTDFEEIAVYDTRVKPNKNDSAGTARIFYTTFNELLNPCSLDKSVTNFEYIYNIFSKSAILKGSFDKYVKEKKGRGTSEVDKEFLKVIEEWRSELAKNIALRNKEIDVYGLNTAIQKIIDRIIFLRIAEDKKSEEYGELLNTVKNSKSGEVYKSLCQIFKKANDKYNSGLFEDDQWLNALVVDDKVLSNIIKGLYYPECPYEFSVLPVEMLGHIYEQFLGKTIRLTASHQAKIEEKPEVRKAGGVYYTPEYIVKYIVENTVGEKCKRKTPEQVAELSVLDPACGSGSFLVGTYEYLLEWHHKYYTKTKTAIKDALTNGSIYQTRDNEYRLTLVEKQKILKNNIYGVDIDAQAVEVSKLSLLLKLMEDENLENQDMLFKVSRMKEKILPDLSNNIKCGNSLIGSDYYDGQNMGLFGTEEMRKVNAFDWKKEYPEIFKSDGFDCVIGNPPYIRIQSLREFSPETVKQLKKQYISASKGNIDIYLIFLEKALQLLRKNGLSGYILPHKFFQGDLGEKTRELISSKKAIRKIISFGSNQIFEQATTYTCLFFMTNKEQTEFYYHEYLLGDDIKNNLLNIEFNKINSDKLLKNKWTFGEEVVNDLLDKLELMPVKLKDITRKIFVGLQTSADKIYVLHLTGKKNTSGNLLLLYSKSLNKEIEIEKDFVKPFLMGKDVKRYKEPENHTYVIFPYLIKNQKAELMTQDYIKYNFPKGWMYLMENKKSLESREKGKFKETWWQYGRLNNLTEFEIKKIMTPEISLGCNMTIDEKSAFYHTTKVYSFIFNENIQENINYFLGILNSKLLWFFLKSTGYVLRGGYFTFKTQYLNNFPIKIINFSIKEDKFLHDNIVMLVNSIIESQKNIYNYTNEHNKKTLQQKADIIDKQIDKLVYALYGLTDEEIKIVEESV